MRYTTRADPGVDNASVLLTSRSTTPRTMEGINGAFKGAQYGSFISHHRGTSVLVTMMKAGAVFIGVLLAIVLAL